MATASVPSFSPSEFGFEHIGDTSGGTGTGTRVDTETSIELLSSSTLIADLSTGSSRAAAQLMANSRWFPTNLHPTSELAKVLACLRLLIRKCVNQNLIVDELVKLLPPGLSPDLQKILVHLLQKHQTQWKGEASAEQATWHRPNNSHVKYGIPPSVHLSTTEIPPSMWPRQNEPLTGFNHIDNTTATPVVANTSVPFVPPPLLQRADGPDNLAIIPRLKSMTWTMKNQKSRPSERVSVISLKLQDYAKSPSGERVVKFQLNKDTLEAMLTSMTYISNQLSNSGGASSGPLQKRPRV